MKSKVEIKPDTEAAKVVKAVIEKMAENQDMARQQIQSGQALPKKDARPV